MLCTEWFCKNGETAKGQTLGTFLYLLVLPFSATPPARLDFTGKTGPLISAVLTGIHY